MPRKPSPQGWDWPVASWWGPNPVPDLSQIPRERWRDALRDTAPEARRVSQSRIEPTDYAFFTGIEMDLLGEDEAEHDRVGHNLAWPDALPVAQRLPRRPRRRTRPPGRQVNFRLEDRNFDALELAASELEMRPTALARLLTMRGLRGLERERRRAAGG